MVNARRILDLLKFQCIIVVIQQLKRSSFIITLENEFCPCSATVASRRDESVKSTVERGEIRGGSLPPPSRDNGARKTSAPVAIVPAPGTMGCPYSLPVPELISRLNRGPIVIGYFARHRHVCLRKKKKKAAATFGGTRTYRFQFLTDNWGLFLSSIILYFWWSGIKAPLKLILYNLYKYRGLIQFFLEKYIIGILER